MLKGLIALLTMAALLAAGAWIQYRLAEGRMWHPLRFAFTTSFGAMLFLAAGGAGYRLDRHGAALADTRWAGEVIWWQVATGMVLAALAVIFWRIAIRDTDRIISQMRERRHEPDWLAQNR